MAAPRTGSGLSAKANEGPAAEGPAGFGRPAQAAGVPGAMRDAILAWYDEQGRFLAFRGTTDPYAILVSEAMAQQTQAARAAEAWGPWLAAFPTIASLAAASPAAVLRAWRGLGYNRRALALRAAAIEVTTRFGGELPRNVAALESLPGVGPYTARAVAALAFGTAVGAVDTNVRRVLLRSVVGARGDELPVVPPRRLQAIADASVPPERPGHWTHAVMDVGAVFCRPRAPRCADCPAVAWCRTGAARVAAAIGEASGDASGVTAAPTPPAEPLVRSRRSTEATAPFESTGRWLRGRILDRLRDAPDGAWVAFRDPVGRHGPPAVAAALAALARERLAEIDPADPSRARLPLA